ncbi:MAG TPA: helix-turn-helix transcriptional regulator [Mycobacterium sp.]|nr:helix-turn-helix transcriptional regulator [Mycobacterium sp.]
MARKKWIDNYFGQRLKLERENKGWSQPEMVKLLEDEGVGLHWTSLAKIEKGLRSVRIDEAKAIADVLELSVDSMLGRKAGLEDDAAHALRGVLDTTRQCELQLLGIRKTLNDRFQDLAMLQFEGREALVSDVDAVWDALDAAQAALGHLAAFQPPKEVRIAPVIEQMLRKQDEGDEAKS